MKVYEVNNPFDYIYAIRDKRGMLFDTSKTLRQIDCYIIGFIMGRTLASLGLDEMTIKFNNGFREFVAKKYNTSIEKTWYEIIETHNSSQSDSFDAFYELIDEFFIK